MTTQAILREPSIRRVTLGDDGLHRALARFVSRRLPSGEAEDVVQDTLADALAAACAPSDPTELRRWVFGIARRKVADHLARSPNRGVPPLEHDGAVAPRGELDAVDLVRWAKQEVGDDPENLRTLGWMVREGLFGETLSSIAEESGLPALRVRQRVSRLRRLLRDKWTAQVGAVMAVTMLVLAWWVSREAAEHPDPDAKALVEPSPLRAVALRADAESACATGDWGRCEAWLDEARRIDPDGEATPLVVRLRQLLRSVSPPPAPTASEPIPTDVPIRHAPKRPAVTPASEEPCVCPDYDPMCGCLPGMGRSIVTPDP